MGNVIAVLSPTHRAGIHREIVCHFCAQPFNEMFQQFRLCAEFNVHSAFAAQHIYAMECASKKYGPDHFAQRRNDEAGWIVHHITKAVFEEQDVFDPYSDQKFIQEAVRLLPWYVKRYTER